MAAGFQRPGQKPRNCPKRKLFTYRPALGQNGAGWRVRPWVKVTGQVRGQMRSEEVGEGESHSPND